MNRTLAGIALPLVVAGVAATVLTTSSAGAAAPTPVATLATSSAAAPSGTGNAAGRTLAAVKARGATAISRRETTLTTALTAVADRPQLTSADRAALASILDNDRTALTALGRTLAADTDPKAARADYRTIFTGYRVYALAVPQAHFVAAADTLTGTALPALTGARSTLQKALAADPGKETAAVRAAMADLSRRIADIGTQTGGVADTVLGYTPAQYNADHALLSGARAKLRTARADVKAARQDVVTVRKALR